MIISRTPYRISFFGGGTDYPGWYLKHGGEVLATTIDKYCYITCRYLPPFFEHRLRIAYSKVEECQNVNEVKHSAVREILKFLSIKNGLEIHHDGDLPARSGIGSSSSFTVGLLHALYALKGTMPSKHQLSMESIHIEQNMIKETVGSQDQVSAAYGGFNHIRFMQSGEIDVQPMTLSPVLIQELNSHLMLFYTGIIRNAEEVAKSYVNDIENKGKQLMLMGQMVPEAISILNTNNDLNSFGELLHEAWVAKRSLSNLVSNSNVDDIYDIARKAGAVGGKLSGAGGGGFLFLFVPPEKQPNVLDKLNQFIHIPFNMESTGSQIIFYDPERKYATEEKARSLQFIKPFKELNVKPGSYE